MAVLGLTGGVTQQVRAQRVVADSLEVGGFMRHFQMFLPTTCLLRLPSYLSCTATAAVLPWIPG